MRCEVSESQIDVAQEPPRRSQLFKLLSVTAGSDFDRDDEDEAPNETSGTVDQVVCRAFRASQISWFNRLGYDPCVSPIPSSLPSPMLQPSTPHMLSVVRLPFLPRLVGRLSMGEWFCVRCGAGPVVTCSHPSLFLLFRGGALLLLSFRARTMHQQQQPSFPSYKYYVLMICWSSIIRDSFYQGSMSF